MALPSKLKNMMYFNDGTAYTGLSKSVTLPVLARKMEAFRGAGMNGPAKSDLGMSDDVMQIEWTLGGLGIQVLKQFGKTRADGVPMRWVGAYQADDTGTVQAVEIIARGRHETIDMGEAAPGEDTEHKITTVLTYYKLAIDGADVIEIDVLNFIERVDGVDLLEAQRQALGI